MAPLTSAARIIESSEGGTFASAVTEKPLQPA
jgi:hypothetical protein